MQVEKVYYHSETDSLYIYLGKSTLPYFYRYQFLENGVCNLLLSPRDFYFVGEL